MCARLVGRRQHSRGGTQAKLRCSARNDMTVWHDWYTCTIVRSSRGHPPVSTAQRKAQRHQWSTESCSETDVDHSVGYTRNETFRSLPTRLPSSNVLLASLCSRTDSIALLSDHHASSRARSISTSRFRSVSRDSNIRRGQRDENENRAAKNDQTVYRRSLSPSRGAGQIGEIASSGRDAAFFSFLFFLSLNFDSRRSIRVDVDFPREGEREGEIEFRTIFQISGE